MTVDEAIAKIRARFPELAESVTNMQIRNAWEITEGWRFPSDIARLFCLAHLVVSEGNDLAGETLQVGVDSVQRTYRSMSGRPSASFWMSTKYGRNYAAVIRSQPGCGVLTV